MKIELEMYTDENDESVVMQKVLEITKHVKQLGFKIGELELKSKDEQGSRHKKGDDDDDDGKHHDDAAVDGNDDD